MLNVQAAPTQYNLLDVYNMALKNDAQLAAARASMKATQETVNQSRASLLPTLGLSANTQYNKVGRDYVSGGEYKDNYNSHGWGATLTQPLFNMNSWFTYEQAKSVGDQASVVFANAQQQLILRVADSYFNVLRSEDSLMTAKAQERALKQQMDQAQERYNVGLIAETDVLDARAAYDNARVARIQAENQVFISYEQLRTIVNQDVTDIAHLEKAMPVVAPTPENPEEWVNTALANNLELKATREGLTASESKVKVSKSGYAPTVNAFASYNYSSSNSVTSREAPYSGDGNQTVVGVQFDLPIFSGGSTTAVTRQAGYQLEEAQKNYDQQLRDTNANTRSLLRTATSDVDRVHASCQVILSSESALKATQSGYEVGTRSITDVLDAQQQLYSSISNYQNTRYDFIVNTLKLKQVAGTLSPADLEALNQWMTNASDELSVPDECRG
ncbi:TolC family outer membrane protein [Endozoicomonas sp. SCSIO W0465]|uniref:TolC family outer membrane protein n=1 Tax=Endozoicomonas sp. SCSIO W0465 TaxID=2918516 RepID=UPI002076263F|nr:TolC family outer membrane protein [Endozoicomonas sp. SCSIO W0465]USE35122.1 TolC family outer membrane protein [Endozoicomonas sp. SCSIO W0465]